jgi:ABC-type antimicrobial peptide transport system permease subunit
MFFTYIYRELRRRHRQALLTALGLAVGVALVVAVTAYANGVSKAQDEVLHSLYGVGTDVSVTQTAKLEQGQGGPMQFGMNPGDDQKQGQSFSRDQLRSSPGQTSISAKKMDTIADLDGVSAVTGSLVLSATHMEGKFAQAFTSPSGSSEGGSASEAGATGTQPQPSASQAPIKISSFTLAGVDVANAALGPLSSSEVVSGRSLTSADAKAKVALVDKAYAKQQSLSVGDTVKVSGKKFGIVGIVTASSGTSSSNVFIPLAWAQKLSDNEGAVNQIYVRATSADQISKVKSEIKTVMPKATVTSSEDLAEQVSGSLSSASSLADRLGKWLAIAALVSAFLVASLLTVSAVSRRVREFGTLKALGWRSPRIVGQVVGESAVQGVIGGVIGVCLGILGAKAIAWFSPSLQASLGASAGGAMQGGPTGAGGGAVEAVRQAAQTVTVNLTAPVSVRLVLVAIALAVAGGLVAGALGGWRASRLRPADALRRLD